MEAIQGMSAVKWSNPKKAQVVIFDKTGNDVLRKMILKDIDHAILCSRYEAFYITFNILFGVLKNMKHMGTMYQGKARGLIEHLKKLAGCLYRVYLLACIEYMKPKVVITFIDNSRSFQLISRIYKNAQFIAIQNGARIRDDLRDSLPPFPLPGSVMSMPVLICFGQKDVDLYKTYNHQIDTYYPLGSLKARYFRSFLSKETPEHQFDLCLISQWDEAILLGGYFPQAKRALITLHDFLSRYIKEKTVRFCIALRSDDKKEEEYFFERYGDYATRIRFDSDMMSSYHAIDQSVVTIDFASTLSAEAFGWGAKVFLCNFSGDDQFDFPCKGFWSLNEDDYELFKKRLDYMREMDVVEYRRQTKECASYIMNNDSKPHHELIRGLIFERISSRLEHG